MNATKLPSEFADLERFVPEWCLGDIVSRFNKLRSSTIDELKEFYNAVLPRLPAMTEHLNKFPLDNMPPPEQALMKLALTFAETSYPIDLGWKTTELPGIFPFERYQIGGGARAW